MDTGQLQQLLSALSSLSHQLQTVIGNNLDTTTNSCSAPSPATATLRESLHSDGTTTAITSTSSHYRPLMSAHNIQTSALSTGSSVTASVNTRNTDNAININSIQDFPPLQAPTSNMTYTRPTYTQTTSHQTATLPPPTHVEPLMDLTFPPDVLREIQVLLRGRTGGILGRAPLENPRAPIPQIDTTNPDFTDLVKTLNTRARLLHAGKNWEKLPPSINRNLNQIAASKKPPMASQEFRNRINAIFEDLKKKPFKMWSNNPTTTTSLYVVINCIH